MCCRHQLVASGPCDLRYLCGNEEVVAVFGRGHVGRVDQPASTSPVVNLWASTFALRFQECVAISDDGNLACMFSRDIHEANGYHGNLLSVRHRSSEIVDGTI